MTFTLKTEPNCTANAPNRNCVDNQPQVKSTKVVVNRSGVSEESVVKATVKPANMFKDPQMGLSVLNETFSFSKKGNFLVLELFFPDLKLKNNFYINITKTRTIVL